MKILLILSDGVRPDRINNNPVIRELMTKATYCMDAQTVMPSVTLPCHMSLFHSVDPSRHGITTNYFVPQMHTISGLFEQIAKKDKKSAMFYNWDELRDLARPGSIVRSSFASGYKLGWEKATRESFADAMRILPDSDIDFAFLYLGWPDEMGHAYGWDSDIYLHATNECCKMLGEAVEKLGDEYTVIFTADHGGHDRMHGTDSPEDMTIPFLFIGKPFAPGCELHGLSIKDIAPTIADLLEADPAPEWEGKIIR